MQHPSLSPHLRHTLVWLALFGLVTLFLVAPQRGVEAAAVAVTPDNADAYLLQPLAAAAQTDPHAAPSYLGLNPAQDLQMVFAPQRVDVRAAAAGDQPWQLGLQVAGWGRGEAAATAVTAAVVNANRIDYQHDAFSEWYVNTAQGLKHGFTIEVAPLGAPATAPLRVEMRVDGTLSAQISADGQSINFVTATGAALLRYDGLVVFDAQQRPLPAHFVTAAGGFAIQIDDRGAVYPLTVDPLLTSYVTKHLAPAGAADDHFGYEVNISSATAIVGVPGSNTRGADAGAAHIYRRAQPDAGQWLSVAELVPTDGAAGDQFGYDVYITAGVVGTVGAPGANGGVGAAYLFERDHTGPAAWGQLTKLTPNDGAAGDRFGAAVSTQGNTAAIGAPNAVVSGTTGGAVYLFLQPDPNDHTTWTQVKKLVAPEVNAGDRFGAAVVVSVDIIAVGAPGDDDACPNNSDCNTGAVYIFERNLGGPGQWGLMSKRVAADATPGAELGTSINFSEGRVIAGAPGDSQKGAGAGAAYVFDRNLYSIDSWSLRTKIVAPDGAPGDRLGSSVGIGGNIAIVGAPGDDDNGADSGSAYLAYFRLENKVPGLEQTVKILAPDGKAGDGFGRSVDQRSAEIVIGAPDADDPASNAGAIYFYHTPLTMGTLQLVNNVEPNAANTNWNFTVAGNYSHADSLAGDGETTPVVLAPGTYTITQSAGANTNLSNYLSTYSCTVGGNPGPTGTGTSIVLTIASQANVRCTFTHLQPGTISIKKTTQSGEGTGFSFTDDIAAPNNFTLDAGGEKTFSGVEPGVYTVEESLGPDWRLTGVSCVDPDSGSVNTGAKALIDLDAGEAIACTFVNKAKTGISVVLTAAPTLAKVGDKITYTYRIINDSAVSLANVTATDSRLGPVTLSKTTLVPGEEITATRTYTVVAGDLPGPLDNTVTVSGTPGAGDPETDSTSVSVNLEGTPGLQLAITSNVKTAGVQGKINFTYRVTNTGSALLTNVRVVDTRLGEVNLVDTSLEPGESTTGGLTYEVVEADMPGPLTITAQAVGKSPAGVEVTADASATIALTKTEPEPEPEPDGKRELFLPLIP